MEAVKSFFRRYLLGVKISREVILKVLSLLILFVISLILRIYPILYGSGAFIRAYDPYIQYYAAKYIVDHGILNFLSSYHKQFWYPWGKYLGKSLYLGIPISGAFFYKFLILIGIRADLFTVVAIMPGVFGALTIFPIYGIAKQIKGDKAALIATTFAAFSPGLLQRTITGFYDNESMGILFLLFSLYFFLKSSNERKVVYSILSGLFLGLLIITWGLYRYLLLLYALYIIVLSIIGKIDIDSITSYITTVLIALAIGALAPRNAGLLTSTEAFISVAVVAFSFLVLGISVIAPAESARREFLTKVSIIGVISLLFAVSALLALGLLKPIAGKFLRVINPLLRGVSPAFSSVSENQPAGWGTIFSGTYLSIILVPMGIYYFVEDRSKSSIFALIATLTAIYFSASISRFIVVGAPILAIAAGIGADFLLEPFSRVLRGEWFIHHVRPIKTRLGEMRLPKGEAVAVYAIVFLILIGSVNHVVWSTKNLATYDVASYEKEAFDYLKMYAQPTDIVLAWWDYGYRLSVLANVTTLADNATSNSTQMGVIGAMFMLPENESIKLMKRYNVKYVVVYTVDLFKAIWMIRISEKYSPELGIKEADYYNSGPGGGYKEKFFYSVLWKLVMYKESDTTVRSWVYTIGEKAIRENYMHYVVNKLTYFRLVLNTKKDSHGFNIKIYEVIYRGDTPTYIDKSVSKKSFSGEKSASKVFTKFVNSEEIREVYGSEKYITTSTQLESIPAKSHQIFPKPLRDFSQL